MKGFSVLLAAAQLSLVCAFCSFTAPAQAADPAVPAALQPWQAWAMKGQEYHACPFLAVQRTEQSNSYYCVWPGVLSIAATKDGAVFTQHLRVEAGADFWVMLPGDTQDWPQDVTLNGQPAVVLDHPGYQGNPALHLGPGTYAIAGHFIWERRPESLRLPESDGLVRLVVDGEKVAEPERDNGYLVLGRGGAGERESLDIRVFRKLSDGVPAMLDTDLQFDVGGLDREQVFGPVLPPDFAPVSITGDLAARLDADGRLHVQIKSGSWELHILARSMKPLIALSGIKAPAPWPTQEIWSYEADPHLRLSSVHGPAPIDPKQAGVPDDWASLPAFIMTSKSALAVTENSRGLASTEGNRLTLVRDAWLDFDGQGYTYVDRFSGTMRRDWRLDVPSDYRLEHAEENDEGQDKPLLITADTDGAGIEVRNPHVDVTAGLRLPQASGDLPVAGWKQSFDGVITELHLPYGYLLVGAPGADGVQGSWAASWTLLDIFIVAVLAVLAFRLFGRVGGLLALVYLVLGHNEPGVPLWTLALVIGFELAQRWLPQGRLRETSGTLGRVALLLLVLVSLPFIADQVRWAVYPQLQPSNEWGFTHAPLSAAPMEMASIANAPTPPPPPPPRYPSEQVPQATASVSSAQLGKIEVTGTRIRTSDLIQRYADDTVIQAGEGEPAWELGSTYKLTWDGPVVEGQTARLIVASPWMTRLLRLVLVASLALLIAALVNRRSRSLSGWRLPGLPSKGVATLALAFAVGALLPRSGHADGFPTESMLKDLTTRLTEAPSCAPQCASISRADVHAHGDVIEIRLLVAAATRVALPIPSSDKGPLPDHISIDGVSEDAVATDGKGLLIAVSRGVHAVMLSYPAPAQGKYALSFGLNPGYMAFVGEGWTADGINEHVLQTGTLGLTRIKASAPVQGSAAPSQAFPPFVILTRYISFDLDWYMDNRAQRVAPTEGGFTVDLPLLPSEHVTSSTATVHGDHVSLPFQNDSREAGWHSTLPRSDSFTLVAPAMADHTEIWKVVVSPTWHVEFSGVPFVDSSYRDDDYWTYEFHPLPGERLTIKITRPAAMPGPTLAIDSSVMVTQVGDRASSTTLQLSLRSTQAGDHSLKIPADAEIMSVSKDGTALNVPLRDGSLTLPITADHQSFVIDWREPRGTGLVTRLPETDLGIPAADAALTMKLPRDRWVLFTFGPSVGPAVLYWGELLVMLLVAWGLSKMAATPLRFRHWLLLGLGFSTFSWPALVAVAAWILAMQWRMDMKTVPEAKYFKALQVGLLVLSVIAMGSIVSSIPYGLLGVPYMHITGSNSTATQLNWFIDRTAGPLPTPWVVSLPMWCYKLAMLAWALWLAFALVGWLRWAFEAWMKGGYWPEARRPDSDAAQGESK